MKIFSVLLAVTLAAQAAPSDPGTAAIDFLEKVREGKLNLEPGGDTALSAQTAKGKRKQIEKRLERLARDLGSDPLEVGAVKQDENFAAVLVRKVGGFDPGRLQVFPVALVKRDAEWEAAPVPASFENSGAGYAVALRQRIEQLEEWMLREQVLDLEKLREQSNSRMRRRIEAGLTESELRKFDVRKTGDRFLTACGAGDLPSLLGVLGGLGSKLPDDWSARLKSAEKAIEAGSAAPRPWRLLVAPDVARVLVSHETDGLTGSISIACLDPAGTDDEPPQIEVVHFPLSKAANGLWRIDPPAPFLREKGNAQAGQTNRGEDPAHDGDPDSELTQRFPALWTEAHPPAPQASAELAGETWLAAMREGRFQSLLAVADIGSGPSAVSKAAQVWWTIRGGAADLAMPLAFQTDGSRAAGIYQFFTARDPDKLDARPFYFEKSPAGWLWTPQPSAATRDKLKPWVDEQIKGLDATWQQRILSACPVVADVGGLESPSEEEARECVGAWLEAIRHGDVQAAITRLACLDSPRSGALSLQNLGYEIAGARGKAVPSPVIAIHQAKPWTAVGVKTIREGGKSSFPLYTVVKTSQGPRILLEIDLFSSDNRSRDFLNNAALVRLGKGTGMEAETALRTLLEKHQASVAAETGKISN
ncbi:MAG: hypothetical protein V4689_10975 [Verrucomicrobiota bacterium]